MCPHISPAQRKLPASTRFKSSWDGKCLGLGNRQDLFLCARTILFLSLQGWTRVPVVGARSCDRLTPGCFSSGPFHGPSSSRSAFAPFLLPPSLPFPLPPLPDFSCSLLSPPLPSAPPPISIGSEECQGDGRPEELLRGRQDTNHPPQTGALLQLKELMGLSLFAFMGRGLETVSPAPLPPGGRKRDPYYKK